MSKKMEKMDVKTLQDILLHLEIIVTYFQTLGGSLAPEAEKA